MFYEKYFFWAVLAFVALNILLPLAAFLFWVVIRIPGPVTRFVQNRLSR